MSYYCHFFFSFLLTPLFWDICFVFSNITHFHFSFAHRDLEAQWQDALCVDLLILLLLFLMILFYF